ncbi:MAG: c-type cytochrome [Verrucomicrobiales bacterium]
MNPDPTSNLNIDYRSTLNVARVHNATARENPERHAESRPISLWVSLAAIVIASIGATYFGANVGFGAAVAPLSYNKFGLNYQPKIPPSDAGVVDEGPVDPLVEGAKVYKSVCTNCHQINGLGVPGQYPPLDGSEWVIGSDERLAAIVSYGMTGPVTVKGQTFGAAVMPPHKPPTISSKKLAYVMTYIRNSWGNKAAPVSPEGVDSFLKRIGERNPYVQAEVLQIPENQMLPGPAAGATPGPATPAAGPPAAGPPASAPGGTNAPPAAPAPKPQ